MEYTGKESYGGTADDGGRREMDKVIEILNKWLVFRTLERQPYRNAAIQELAKAIDDLYKGDENGLLTDETIAKIWAGGGDHKEIAKAQQALDKRKEQERADNEVEYVLRCFGATNEETQKIKKDIQHLRRF